MMMAMFLTMTAGAMAQAYLDETQPMEKRVEDALSRMTLTEKVRMVHAQSNFSSAGVPRLGIPEMWTSDGPHGVRPQSMWGTFEDAGQTNDSCVAFPALICLAATWNPQLAMDYGKALGEEALYREKDMMLGPGVNIYRTPLNGRNFEYMGEDPWLASRMVVPYVQGLQQNGVAACVKHYALNNTEKNRYNSESVVSERALREIYLPAFEAAVKEGKTWGIMGAYNMYNGQFCCHNQWLLNDILKGEWGFDGVVVSDWGGCHDTDQAATNGLDIEFGTGTNGLEGAAVFDAFHLAKAYQQKLEEGKLPIKDLDDKVRRILRLIFRTAMNSHKPFGTMCSAEHYATARHIAQEGIVLLKNDAVKPKKGKAAPLLPLNVQRVKSVLVVGENAVKKMTLGGGSSSLRAQCETVVLEALKQRLEPVGIVVDYSRGYIGEPSNTDADSDNGKERSDEELTADALKKAQTADVVIYVGGLNKSSGNDGEGHDRRRYTLPYDQNQLLESLEAVNKNIVFVSISGNAFEMPFISKIPAMVQAWYIGSETGGAITDVLTGEVNPSGKLPITWAVTLDDYPAHKFGKEGYPGVKSGKSVKVQYAEDLYVGYRGVDKYGVKPVFAFGYGLSYTTFQLSNLRVDKTRRTDTDKVTLTVTVKNTGHCEGAETVQLYISDKESALERPLKELKGFQKVCLKAGESRDVSITLDIRAFQYWNDSQHQWTTEPGEFELLVGTASDNLPLKATIISE